MYAIRSYYARGGTIHAGHDIGAALAQIIKHCMPGAELNFDLESGLLGDGAKEIDVVSGRLTVV